jgi:phosphatidylinositol alpha-1,6-mannosyltransferase
VKKESQCSPILCAITQVAGYGGIARVSRMLLDVLQTISGNTCQVVELCSGIPGPVSPTMKVRFASVLASRQLQREVSWIVFDHLALARIQPLVPTVFRRPYAVFLHDIEAWGRMDWLQKAALKGARVRIANSQYTANRVTSAHPDVGSVHVCHLALPRLEPAAGQPNAALLNSINRSVVLIVGRMGSTERYKGHDQLLAAWPEVKRRVPAAQLIVVGDGDDVPRLEREASFTTVGSSILFTGRVDEHTLHAIYDRAALFVMPSSREGFGLVYLEAMHHRLPCIGSTEDAASEVIVQGQTGLLVAQSDVSGLAEAIVKLLQDTALRRQMGEAGCCRLEEIFSFSRFQARVIQLLQPLCGPTD